MKKNQSLMMLATKRLLFFSLPIVLLLYILYEVILGLDMSFSWTNIIIYAVLIGLVTIRNYGHKSINEKIEDVDHLEYRIMEGRWKILERGENSLSLKPRFDFPYSQLSKDTVQIQYSDYMATIEGPWYYVDQLARDIRGKRNIWIRRIAGFGLFILVLAIVSIPVLFETGIYWDLRKSYHNYQIRNVDIIEIQDKEAYGNTVENTNNYGYGAENEEYIFYVKSHLNLVRADRDLRENNYLIEKSGGNGINMLNVAGDWIFYSSGETLNRMQINGTDNQTIYKMGYLLDIHIKGNWIYFINPSDKFNMYRMDVNGKNLERFLKVQASDIALYDDRLFYSYKEDDKGYVESVNLDREDRKVELETMARDLTRWKGYYYYIGEDFKLFRNEIGKNAPAQLLVEDKVSSYIVTYAGIYYSLHSDDVGYPGEGLYRTELDGMRKTLVSDTKRVEGFTQVGEWILFHSSDSNFSPKLKRLNLQSGSIEAIE